jgi:hypothetical protein
MAAEMPGIAKSALQTWVVMCLKRGKSDHWIAEGAGVDTEQLERYLAGADPTPMEVAERLRVAFVLDVAPTPEDALALLSEIPEEFREWAREEVGRRRRERGDSPE